MLALAIYLALHGQISLGDILTFSILFMNVMTPLSEIHRVIDEGHEASLRVGDLLKMLAEPVDRSFGTIPGNGPLVEAGHPIIAVDGLRVEYRTADARQVRALDRIDLTIRHGEVIGVAGKSGCGKSTWLKVLMRFTHPHSGTVHVGGIALEDVSRPTSAA